MLTGQPHPTGGGGAWTGWIDGSEVTFTDNPVISRLKTVTGDGNIHKDNSGELEKIDLKENLSKRKVMGNKSNL